MLGQVDMKLPNEGTFRIQYGFTYGLIMSGIMEKKMETTIAFTSGPERRCQLASSHT